MPTKKNEPANRAYTAAAKDVIYAKPYLNAESVAEILGITVNRLSVAMHCTGKSFRVVKYEAIIHLCEENAGYNAKYGPLVPDDGASDKQAGKVTG